MKKILIAVPKGRILQELAPLFSRAGIVPQKDFFDGSSRKIIFQTNRGDVEIMQVRSFDVATFVKFGAADIGICGFDVLEEFSSPEIFSVLDLKIGRCRLALAAKKGSNLNLEKISHIKVATKYPEIAKKYFAKIGVQCEVIKLNGAIEIAPALGLCDAILDLVSSGQTLLENDIAELQKIFDVTSRLIVNRTSLKTNNDAVNQLIKIFDAAA